MVKILLAFVVFVGLWYGRASAAPCNPAHTFITGEVLTAAVLNANPNNEKNCFGNIDNTNIGAAGIFGSQITATSVATATFAGSFGYTFPNGVTSGTTVSASLAYAATACGSLPFQVQGSGGTNEFGASSAVSAAAVVAQTFGICFTTSSVLAIDNAGDLGITGSYNTPLNVEALTGEGDFKALASGANSGTRSFVPPIYTPSGAAVANTLHGVLGSCSISAASQCTITFTGQAVFTSATSFACGGVNSAGSAFIANPVNPTASSITLSTGGGNETGTLTAICIGT